MLKKMIPRNPEISIFFSPERQDGDVRPRRYIPQPGRGALRGKRADYAFYRALRLRRCNSATSINFEGTRYRRHATATPKSVGVQARVRPMQIPRYTGRSSSGFGHEVNTETPIDSAR